MRWGDPRMRLARIVVRHVQGPAGQDPRLLAWLLGVLAFVVACEVWR